LQNHNNIRISAIEDAPILVFPKLPGNQDNQGVESLVHFLRDIFERETPPA
jgi:hypothetical protein